MTDGRCIRCRNAVTNRFLFALRRDLLTRTNLARHLLFAVAVVVLRVPPAGAQAGGSVSGTIKDPSGGVVPGATVTLTNAGLGNQFTGTSDGQGVYAFPNVPVGRYDLTVELDGFKP